MDELVDSWPAGSAVSSERDLADEFEARLEVFRLAVRVAYSVLRSREDAQDVAQEAFIPGVPALVESSRWRQVPSLARPHHVASRAQLETWQPASRGARGRGSPQLLDCGKRRR